MPEIDGHERRPIEAFPEAGRAEQLMDPSPLGVAAAEGSLAKESIGLLEPPPVALAGFVPESAGSGITTRPEALDEAFAVASALESEELRALPRRDQVVDVVLEEAIRAFEKGQENERGETAREATHLRDHTMGCARTVWYSTT
jgi:hypothetical protein